MEWVNLFNAQRHNRSLFSCDRLPRLGDNQAEGAKRLATRMVAPFRNAAFYFRGDDGRECTHSLPFFVSQEHLITDRQGGAGIGNANQAAHVSYWGSRMIHYQLLDIPHMEV